MEKSASGSYSVPPSSDAGKSMPVGAQMTTQGATGDSFQDLIVLYCSYFSYAPDGAEKRLEIILTPVNDIILRIHRLETQKVIAEGTSKNVGLFLEADENTQRDLFDQPQVSIIFISTIHTPNTPSCRKRRQPRPSYTAFSTSSTT